MSEKEGIMGGMDQEQQVLSSRMNEAWRLPVVLGGGGVEGGAREPS